MNRTRFSTIRIILSTAYLPKIDDIRFSRLAFAVGERPCFIFIATAHGQLDARIQCPVKVNIAIIVDGNRNFFVSPHVTIGQEFWGLHECLLISGLHGDADTVVGTCGRWSLGCP